MGDSGSDTARRRSMALGAVLAAAFAAASVDLALSLARSPALPGEYFAVYLTLTAFAALVAGALGAFAPGIPLGLAAWTGLQVGLVESPVWGFAAGLAACAALLAGPRSHAADALAIAFALVLGWLAWPRLALRLGVADLAWLAVAVFTLAVVGCGFAARRASRLGLPRPLAAALLLVGLASGAFLWRPAERPDARDLVPRAAAADAAPHVIVLVLDTVRADHLSVYGYARETSPRLEALLTAHPGARRFDLAFATGTWTAPTHASLFTGLLPSDHGVHARNISLRVPRSFPRLTAESTLAEVLRQSGYRTGAVLANEVLLQIPGLDRGFEHFDSPSYPRPPLLAGEGLRARWLPHRSDDALRPYAPAVDVNAALLGFLEGCADTPCFAVANYMDAHAPYAAPPPFAGRFTPRTPAPPRRSARAGDDPALLRRLEARYDEAIASLDAALGELFAEFGSRGLLEKSWIVVTSDHGEAFGEHGLTEHGTGVYNEQTRVPLLVWPPRGDALPRRGESPRAVGLLDVAATLAAIGGHAGFGDGVDLRDPAAEVHRVAIEKFGGLYPASRHGAGSDRPARAVVESGFKLVERAGTLELYDLTRDLTESRDLRARRVARVERLTAQLPPLAPAPPPIAPVSASLSADSLRALEALGYLGD